MTQTMTTQLDPETRLRVLAMKVKQMRDKQREYFRTRDKAVMRESKDLEARVDRQVDEILDDKPRLF